MDVQPRKRGKRALPATERCSKIHVSVTPGNLRWIDAKVAEDRAAGRRDAGRSRTLRLAITRARVMNHDVPSLLQAIVGTADLLERGMVRRREAAATLKRTVKEIEEARLREPPPVRHGPPPAAPPADAEPHPQMPLFAGEPDSSGAQRGRGCGEDSA